ncbi:class I tRNA ligase family protein, partial [Staphylococcus warneri]|uniref:class I tRNA ligase family protein n=1 Tax=Staphylococcus warneri TaxID=1292 RepID=UPI0011A56605
HHIRPQKFLQQASHSKQQYATFIPKQSPKLPLPLHYSTQRFTFHHRLTKPLKKLFLHLYNKDIIYTHEPIINSHPQPPTPLSHIQLIHQHLQRPFYHFKYP